MPCFQASLSANASAQASFTTHMDQTTGSTPELGKTIILAAL